MQTTLQPEAIAVLLTRLLLGMLFLFQGYDKVFKVRIAGVIRVIEPAYSTIRIPRFLIKTVAIFTSYVEFFGGLLLILGILKYYTLYILGLDLLVVSFGMSIINPVWKMDIVMPRFILLIILLLLPAQYDIYTIPNLLLKI